MAPVRCRYPFSLYCFSTAQKRGNRHRGSGATTLTGPTCSGVVLRQCPPGAVCTVATGQPCAAHRCRVGPLRVAALPRTAMHLQFESWRAVWWMIRLAYRSMGVGGVRETID